MNRVTITAAALFSILAFALSLYAILDKPTARELEDEEQSEAAPAKERASSKTAAPAGSAGDDLILRNRVDRLAERMAALERRAARTVPVAAVPGAAASPQAAPELVDLRPLSGRLLGLEQKVDKLAGLLPKPVATALTDDEAAREAVSGIVEEQLDKFRQERRERRRAMGDQVTDELVNEFADKAGLSDEQFRKLYPALGEMRQEMRENFRAMRRGEKDFADVRAAAKAARESFDEKARTTLNDEQYKMYQEEMNERLGGRGGLFR